MWAAASQVDLERVVDLLGLISVPATLDVDANSSASYNPSTSQAGSAPFHSNQVTFAGDGLASAAHDTLKSLAPALAILHDSHAQFLRMTSDRAAAVQQTQTMSGALGIAVYFNGYVLEPLNAILQALLQHTGHRVYWQIAGTGETHAHLRWHVPGAGAQATTLGIIQFKTKLSLPLLTMDRMLDEISGQVGNDHCHPASRRVLDEVCFQWPARAPLTPAQLGGQVRSCRPHIAFLCNYETLLPCRCDHDGATTVLHFDELKAVDESASLNRLAGSVPGLLLGASLCALLHHNPSISSAILICATFLPPPPTPLCAQAFQPTQAYAQPAATPAASDTPPVFRHRGVVNVTLGADTNDVLVFTTTGPFTAPVPPRDSLLLGPPFGYGSTATAFEGILTLLPKSVRCVVKMTEMDKFAPEHGDAPGDNDDDHLRPTRAQVRAAFWDEDTVLRRLEGYGVAPRLYGSDELYWGDYNGQDRSGTLFTVMENVGEEMPFACARDERVQ